jgi:hypothetical protein
MAANRWRFCVIGGLAVIRWGEPRLTMDVDLMLLTGFGNEMRYAGPLLEKFEARVNEALKFALRRRVLLLRASNKKDVDISFGALPFEESIIKRATPFEFAPGVRLITCSAEDLFILKVFAGRGQDWQDAQSVAIRQKLDKRYIMKHLKPLFEVKETPELLLRARKLLEGRQ